MDYLLGSGVIAFAATAIAFCVAWALERGDRINYGRDNLQLKQGIEDANDELKRERNANIAERKLYQSKLRSLRASMAKLGDTDAGRTALLDELDGLLSPEEADHDSPGT